MELVIIYLIFHSTSKYEILEEVIIDKRSSLSNPRSSITIARPQSPKNPLETAIIP